MSCIANAIGVRVTKLPLSLEEDFELLRRHRRFDLVVLPEN
jgi:hypothetical protein